MTNAKTTSSAFNSFGRIAARVPHVGAGQRIGLLGGSFDPPHAAHLLISTIAARRLQLDAVWWLVTPGNPLKRDRPPPSIEARAAQCRALVGSRRIVVTTFEKDLATPYTASTLAFLRLRAPKANFVWLMGADSLAQFHRWRHWRQIFAGLPVAVVDRPGWRLRALASPAASAFSGHRLPEVRAARLTVSKAPQWCFLTGQLSPLSSTALRRKAGQS